MNKTTKTNFSFCAIILAIIMVISSLSFIGSFFVQGNSVLAVDKEVVDITNSNFNDNKVTGNVITPTGWQTINSSNTAVSGIISINEQIFESNMEKSYKLSFKPYKYNGMSDGDEQILMINGKDSNISMGYKSPSFTLSKNSYYMITFRALTENTDDYIAIGSANLSGNDILVKSAVSVYTNGNWVEYTFLIETDKINDVSANLELWLGSKNGSLSYGAIFFDDVNVYKLSQSSFSTTLKANANNKNFALCNMNTSVSGEQFTNSDFEQNILTGWEVIAKDGVNKNNPNNYIGVVNFNDNNYSEKFKLDNQPVGANFANNNQASLINNKQASQIGLKSSYITIKQFGMYKISFYAKANVSSGNATVRLVEKDPYNNAYSTFSAKDFSIEISNEATDKINNDWVEYSFYVKGRSFEDTQVCVEIWLGYDEEAVGSVMVDNFTVYHINSSNYSSGKSLSNTTEANFSDSSTLTIANGKFNNATMDLEASDFPYTPSDWTSKVVFDNEIQSGIINTKDTSMISRIINPTSGNKYSNNNNILMIGNNGKNTQTFTSSGFTLEANKYYKLVFKVQTQSLTNGATAGVKLYTSTMTIKELMYIESNNVWTTYTILIRTGENSYNCNVELSLGYKNAGSGYAFFDDVIITESSLSTYNADLKDNQYRVDLKVENFTNTPDKSIDNIYSTNSLTATNKSNTASSSIITGAVSTTDSNAFTGKLAGIENPMLPSGKDGNVLLIHSIEDCYYYYTTNQKFSLTQDKFYKISIWVKTNNLTQLDDSKVETSTKGEYYPLGATISLTSINKTFSGINTNNEWKEYTFYINATDSAEVQVLLSLGSENAYTSGTVFFSSVSVESIESNTYYDSIKILEDADAPENIMAVGSTKVEESDKDNSSSSESSDFNWLILPTLITAIALIIAVVAVGIRKFIKKHPKPVKVQKGQYARELSLEKDFEHKEAIRRQQEKLAKLKEQLEEIKFEIVDTKSEFRKEQKKHKQDIEKQAKEKIAQSADKKKARQEAKAYRKEQRRLFNEEKLAKYKQRELELQVKFNAIEAEIEIIYQEEQRLIKLYKEYRRQVRIKRRELRLAKKNKSNDFENTEK